MSGFVEWLPLLLFALVCLVLMLGYPVAFSLAGTSLLFAFAAASAGVFDLSFLQAVPSRIYGLMTNETLLAVPLFIFMGNMLQQSRLADDLLGSMATLMNRLRGGLGISVVLVGALLAASTGIVGATVVTMGLISLPAMLKRGYHPAIASGAICATGTLGQIIPPSIALVLLGDVLSSAYQQAQRNMGVFNANTVSVGDLFVGALIPGLLLVLAYILLIAGLAWFRPQWVPSGADPATTDKLSRGQLAHNLIPPLLLIVSVLGSILAGIATPTEAAGVGALGASLLAASRGQLNWLMLGEVARNTTRVTCMVFLILIGATVFSLVFRGLGGDHLMQDLLSDMPGGIFAATLLVMLVIFLLGFILDFIEITFVVVPIVAPILLQMGLDPIWLGIMIALNLQTSFLTPPFGFALFYLRGVAPASVTTAMMYRGVVPFILLQLLMMVLLAGFPQLATWLPHWLYA